MRILVTQRSDINQYGDRVDVLEHNLTVLLRSYGIISITVPNDPTFVNDLYQTLQPEGVILSGGNDITTLPPNFVGINAVKRNETEERVLELAIMKGLPVLGICRGMQFIQHYFGGNLRHGSTLELNGHDPGNIHDIALVNQDLVDSLGFSRTAVNTYHNWFVIKSDLPDDLGIFAEAESQSVEGLYVKTMPIVGIQWHPERPGSDANLDEMLFNSFVGRKLFWRNYI